MSLIASGQVTSSGTPTPLSATPLGARKWFFKSLSSNSSQVGVGPAAQPGGAALSLSNAHLLDPGDTIEIDGTIQPGGVFSDLTPDKVYIVGTGDVVSWLTFG